MPCVQRLGEALLFVLQHALDLRGALMSSG